MSSGEDKIIKKKIHHEGVVKKRTNHVTYEDIDQTEKYRIKGKKRPEPKIKPTPREILDNYRYIETKVVRNERRKSIVKHQRLSSPIGKETPYSRNYNTNTSYVQKNSKLSFENAQRNVNQYQNKYSQKTANPRQNKNVEKYSGQAQYSNSRKSGDSKEYSFKKSKNTQNQTTKQLSSNTQKYKQNQKNQQKYNLAQNINKGSDLKYAKNSNYDEKSNLRKNQKSEDSLKQGQEIKAQAELNLQQNQREEENMNLEKNIVTAGDMNLDQNYKEVENNRLEENQNEEGKINIKNNQEIEGRNYNQNIESQKDNLQYENAINEKNQEKIDSKKYSEYKEGYYSVPIENKEEEMNNSNDNNSQVKMNYPQIQNSQEANNLKEKQNEEDIQREINYGKNNRAQDEGNYRQELAPISYNLGQNINEIGRINFRQNTNYQGINNYGQNFNQGGFNLGQNQIIEQNMNFSSIPYGNQYNERTSVPNQNLPFYPSSEQLYKYKSQTANLRFCKNCGKPKRPMEHQRTISLEENRKSITREIIGEQRQQGDYVIRYSNEYNLNQSNNGIIGQQSSQERLAQGFSESKKHFCPIHGYI